MRSYREPDTRTAFRPYNVHSEIYMKSVASIFALLSLPTLFSFAAPAQHQHAELTDQQIGAVHFPISCDSSVQKTFERGVALLHSFAFETAEATFREVAQEDPHCAMAHWGIAATFSRWAGPDDKQRNLRMARDQDCEISPRQNCSRARLHRC